MDIFDLTSAIQKSLLYFVPADATEESVYENLIAEGIGPALADRIIIFTPTAFGRVMMRHLALVFPATYRIQRESGELSDSLLLTSEPVYQAALNLAYTIASAQMWEEALHSEVAYWSAEAEVVSQALVEGYPTANIKPTELIVHWFV
ncbi:hypothetical protein [Hymenobacter elongatus]|uniref:Uncharacterized protein n=1 Tax=Hymenobacter elongatus TaxID=877208 RepID=A0A4Z0PP23_9BACT|nr:hypothetical protein [Hymenobacter elongatus]TGE16399.1 hypothetical protein E5J99_09745 [Hymenobacter elongatus]